MNNIILSVRNVGLCYPSKRKFTSNKKDSKGFWALKDISFDLYQGETLGIIGRNGAGKSTLFKLLAGVIAPSRGIIKKRKNLSVQLLSIGVGFEGHLSGRENAVLNGMLLGRSRTYMLKRLSKIKNFSELGDFFEEPVNTYSSGMVARLGFSIGLEVDADLLLLDEVLSVGDSRFAEKSHQAIKEMINSDRTVILISHSASTIEQTCQRAILVEEGRSIVS